MTSANGRGFLRNFANDFRLLISGKSDSIQGISVASFVQLLAMERKMCRLRAQQGDRTKYLVIRAENLIHAREGKTTEEEATFQIIGRQEATIDETRKIPTIPSDITRGVNEMSPEALRRSDEMSLRPTPKEQTTMEPLSVMENSETASIFADEPDADS